MRIFFMIVFVVSLFLSGCCKKQQFIPEKNVHISLPNAHRTTAPSLVIDIRNRTLYYGKESGTVEQFAKFLAKYVQNRKAITATIIASDTTPFKIVSDLLNLLRKEGVTRISLVNKNKR